ncbi:MAG: sulfatase [Deltaproteobacteria bacterium]|nr:sulfatase [Deltaproteobacteria bacterium]
MFVAACGSKKHARQDAAASVAHAHVDAPIADAAAAKPARVEHTGWVLANNRHTAHRYIGGELVIDAGDIGFARYTRFGLPVVRWKLAQTVDGERAAVADRLASLEIPLVNNQAVTAQLVMHVHGDAKQVLTIKLNGKKVGAQKLAGGWETISVPTPGLFAGENQLVLETTGGKGKVAVGWLRFGTATEDPRAAVAFESDQIELARDASLAWFVPVPDGAQLVAEVPGACRVEVSARANDESMAGGLLGGDNDRVDLSPVAGRAVRLMLTARDCDRAKLEHARITLIGPEPQPLPAAEPPRFVILWVMDALRADKVPIFTPGARAQTPSFDELAKSSAVFRQYYVQGNESQVSHSSMFTSLYPAVHNVRLAGDGGTWRIAEKFHIIGSELTAAGYTTLGVTGNGYVNDEGGYSRGFSEYRNMMRETGIDNNVILGQQIVDAALAKLDKHRDAPAFLFLGTIDTHSPWIARKPWINIYSPGPYHGPFQDFGTAKDLGFKPGSMGCSIIPPKEDVERLRAIYDSAVSYHDQQLGRLIKQLKEWGIWDQTLLIVTADHGDELFEDGRCGHGGSMRDVLVRVPLLIHDPSRFPGGPIIDEGAEGVDLLPTILRAAGKPIFDDAQGEPLEPLAQGIGRGWPRPSYTSYYENGHAMRIGRWKLRVTKVSAPILDDLVADPDEKLDLSHSAIIERRMLTDDLGLFLALRTQWKKSAWGVVTNMTAQAAADLDKAQP